MEHQFAQIDAEGNRLHAEIQAAQDALAKAFHDEDEAKARIDVFTERTANAKTKETRARDKWLSKKQEIMRIEQQIIFNEQTLLKLEKQFETAMKIHTAQVRTEQAAVAMKTELDREAREKLRLGRANSRVPIIFIVILSDRHVLQVEKRVRKTTPTTKLANRFTSIC